MNEKLETLAADLEPSGIPKRIVADDLVATSISAATELYALSHGAGGRS